MSHYSDHVRKFGTTDGYDTAHFEANHKFMLKVFYKRTNKREILQEQLLWHNKRRIKTLAMKDILMASLHTERRKDLTDLLNEDSIQAINTQPTRDPLKLSFYGTIEQTDKRQKEARQWCKARDLAKLIDLPEFIPALAVFIKQQYRAAGNKSPTSRDKYLRERDPSWVERWDNIPWHWRQDYVWVQEHENEADEYSASSIKGKRIGQLQVIVTVQDPYETAKQHRQVTYCGALLKLLRPRGKGINKTTGMLELQSWHKSTTTNPRTLGTIRFYDMTAILRSVHVVLDNGNGYYVNNYADWDTYNTVYDDTFLEAM
ncbi:hypothetical protein MMC07_009396 [Pseudocyphellaria aurata]|nr:hypothetical protein [Pseudocyphellaria aurata]